MNANGVCRLRCTASWVVGLGLLATGCSGGGDNAQVTTTPTVRTTTSGATATTAKADPKDVALAAKAILAKGDLPSDWTEYKAGTGVMTTLTPANRLGCSLPKGQPGAFPWSVAFDGGTYQKAASAPPLEAHLRFRYQGLVDGKIIDANRFEDILVFRHGRTVMILAPQAVASKADPSDI